MRHRWPKNATTAAISSASPNRPHRYVHHPPGRAFGGPWRKVLAAVGVFTGPGHSAVDPGCPWRANCTPSSREHRQHPAFGRGVGDLRGGRSHHRDERGDVDRSTRAVRAPCAAARPGSTGTPISGWTSCTFCHARVARCFSIRSSSAGEMPAVVDRDVDRARSGRPAGVVEPVDRGFIRNVNWHKQSA